MESLVSAEFVTQAIKRINQCTEKVEACLKELDEKDLWFSPNEHLNSIGNLMLHLCGNIRQHIISALDNKPDKRERDLEFSTDGGYKKDELFQKLRETAAEAVKVIHRQKPDGLLRVRISQGMAHTGVDSVLHVTEHYSYHTGQIVLLTKLLKNIDLGFYTVFDLNKKNE